MAGFWLFSLGSPLSKRKSHKPSPTLLLGGRGSCRACAEHLQAWDASLLLPCSRCSLNPLLLDNLRDVQYIAFPSSLRAVTSCGENNVFPLKLHGYDPYSSVATLMSSRTVTLSHAWWGDRRTSHQRFDCEIQERQSAPTMYKVTQLAKATRPDI